MSVASGPGGRRGSQAGPTHVLVVRGLNEQVLEENLHCEFSKHAPIKVMKFLTSVSEQGGD
jgi:RNA-binding protein 5/10